MKISNGERCYGIPHGESVKLFYKYYKTHNWTYQSTTNSILFSQYTLLRFSVWQSSLFAELFSED